MTYEMLDGVIIKGLHAADIVRHMAGRKLWRPRNMSSYRTATANRAKETYDVDIDPSTDQSFLDSLEKHHLVRKLA